MKQRYTIPSLGAMALASKAAASMANQVEDALAGLLINGVQVQDIEVQQRPGKTIIAVLGKPRYEFSVQFTICDSSATPSNLPENSSK